MKIVILSDTHGEFYNMMDALEAEEPYDMVIHCGDICGVYDRLRAKVNCTLHVVAGNMDYDPDMDREKLIDIGNYKAIITHGHRYGVHGDMSPLFYLANENHADIVFFGHTHVPMIKELGPVTLVNPGSLTHPRQHDRKPSYAVGIIEDGKEPQFEIKYM